MTNQKKSVNAVNLKQRTDRQVHILKQFSDKPEFLFNIVPAIIHEKGAYGLWQTISQIVNKENEKIVISLSCVKMIICLLKIILLTYCKIV